MCAATASDPGDEGATRHDPNAKVWGLAPVLAARSLYAMDLLHPGEWVVRELDTRAVPWASAPRCLVFENDDVVRRLWRYPSNWLTITDRALLALVGVTL